jgi:hypothetical protein
MNIPRSAIICRKNAQSREFARPFADRPPNQLRLLNQSKVENQGQTFTNSHLLKLDNIPSARGFPQSAQGRTNAVDPVYGIGNPNIHD